VGPVWVCVWIAAGAVVPVLIVAGFVHLADIFDRVETFVGHLRSGRGPSPHHQSVERLSADLHRLSVHLEHVECSDELHRMARLRAAALAYDDVLLSACRTLQIQVPARSPLDPIERLETEAALAQQGLVW
jgi:hypothetical protein